MEAGLVRAFSWSAQEIFPTERHGLRELNFHDHFGSWLPFVYLQLHWPRSDNRKRYKQLLDSQKPSQVLPILESRITSAHSQLLG